MSYETFNVLASDREPLIAFMTGALRDLGCRIIHEPDPSEAPFRITFETPEGERLGIIAYAFLANKKATKNRPADEHRFQVKYGSKDGRLHRIWQDPFGLYTTVMLGINLEEGFFVGIDPVLHSPTKFFISLEFKEAEAAEIRTKKWHAWERDRRTERSDLEEVDAPPPVEVLVGGTRESFLRFIRFEREALGEDQGHRQLLAERFGGSYRGMLALPSGRRGTGAPVGAGRVHALAAEFELAEDEVLDLIAGARRLKMAVRGWVAEEHLFRKLKIVPGVEDCERLDVEGAPDIGLRFEGSRPLNIECKNVLRERTASGLARVDFQRTRASKADPCSRYYAPGDFDIVAACLHAVTLKWSFKYVEPLSLDPHVKCAGKLSSNVKVDDRWAEDVRPILRAAAARRK